jgi:hypothetical protein
VPLFFPNGIKLALEGFTQGKNCHPLLKNLFPCDTLWVPTKYSLGMTGKKKIKMIRLISKIEMFLKAITFHFLKHHPL